MEGYRICVDIGEGSDFVVLHLIEYKNGEIGCNYIVSNVKVMEEKKTKKMTKVEAYVYLNDTKVYVNGKGDKVLEVLSKVGFEPTFPQSDVDAFPFMGISDKQVTYYAHMKQYLGLPKKEISVDDILSIEIVDENKSEEEKALDKISCLGAQIVDILLRMKGHHHVTITETDVILHDEGMSLFHSDPF